MPSECPLCHAGSQINLLEWGPQGYQVHRCPNCRLLHCTPLPEEEELEAFYQGFLYRKPDARQLRRRVDHARREIIRRFGLNEESGTGGKRFLDYGGGTGVATVAAAELGLDAYLYEVDEQAVGYVRRELGLEPGRAFSDEESLRARSYDYILCDNVIEHVRDPVGFTRGLVDLLSPTGSLVIKTPHAGNSEIFFHPAITVGGYLFRALRFGNPPRRALKAFFARFWHIDPPRHLYGFTEGSFTRLADILALEDFEIGYYRIPLFSYSLLTRTFTVTRRLTPRSVVRRLLSLPFVVLELLTKGVQLLARASRLLSPPGIVLTVHRDSAGPTA